jgi:hypothetical protein
MVASSLGEGLWWGLRPVVFGPCTLGRGLLEVRWKNLALVEGWSLGFGMELGVRWVGEGLEGRFP